MTANNRRVAYSEILPDEKRRSCLRFLFNALRFFRAHGVKVQRVMTDNGVSFRSRRYAKALRLLKIKHLRTKPYTPKTNGKAERFVQTSLREWAYARAYLTSDDRARHLPEWLHRYNPAHQAQSGAEPFLSFLVMECCSRRRPQLDTVRHLTGRDQAPQRDQQLARQCHDHRRLARAARPLGPSAIPARQRTVFLEHQEAPRQLDQPTSYPRIASLGQALLSAFQTALVGRSREPGVARHRSSISKPPRHDLPHQHAH